MQKNRLRLVCTHRRRGNIDANDRQFSLDSKAIGQRMHQLQESKGQGRYGDWRVTREQEISTQTWRIPQEKITINVLKDGVEENVGVYA